MSEQLANRKKIDARLSKIAKRKYGAARGMRIQVQSLPLYRHHAAAAHGDSFPMYPRPYGKRPVVAIRDSTSFTRKEYRIRVKYTVLPNDYGAKPIGRQAIFLDSLLLTQSLLLGECSCSHAGPAQHTFGWSWRGQARAWQRHRRSGMSIRVPSAVC